MQIEMLPIDSVKEYDRNPRVIGEDAVAACARSISEFGFRNPVIVDADDVLIAGHTRLRAARQLGLSAVPAIRASDLTPEQVRGLRIADNQVGTLSRWNDEMLGIELVDLKALGLDLDAIGFSAEQLSELMAPEPTEGLVAADDVPAPPKKAKTKRGDVWTMGSHKLLCGDATCLANVEMVMQGERATLVSTDPPYLVDYTGERPNDSGKDWSATYREVDIKDAAGFFDAVFRNVLAVVAPKAAIYCWHAHKRCGLIQQVWEKLGILDHQQVVWVKPTAVFGRSYWHYKHEPCVMGWVQGSQPEHDGEHAIDSVWEVDWEGKSRVVGNEHPTTKPVELFARPMRKHTKPGDICFEPFSGSGSQIIAAEQLGRRCYAIELEPVFVEVAVRRWEQFTGKKAELVRAAESCAASAN